MAARQDQNFEPQSIESSADTSTSTGSTAATAPNDSAQPPPSPKKDETMTPQKHIERAIMHLSAAAVLKAKGSDVAKIEDVSESADRIRTKAMAHFHAERDLTRTLLRCSHANLRITGDEKQSLVTMPLRALALDAFNNLTAERLAAANSLSLPKRYPDGVVAQFMATLSLVASFYTSPIERLYSHLMHLFDLLLQLDSRYVSGSPSGAFADRALETFRTGNAVEFRIDLSLDQLTPDATEALQLECINRLMSFIWLFSGTVRLDRAKWHMFVTITLSSDAPEGNVRVGDLSRLVFICSGRATPCMLIDPDLAVSRLVSGEVLDLSTCFVAPSSPATIAPAASTAAAAVSKSRTRQVSDRERSAATVLSALCTTPNNKSVGAVQKVPRAAAIQAALEISKMAVRMTRSRFESI